MLLKMDNLLIIVSLANFFMGLGFFAIFYNIIQRQKRLTADIKSRLDKAIGSPKSIDTSMLTRLLKEAEMQKKKDSNNKRTSTSADQTRITPVLSNGKQANIDAKPINRNNQRSTVKHPSATKRNSIKPRKIKRRHSAATFKKLSTAEEEMLTDLRG